MNAMTVPGLVASRATEAAGVAARYRDPAPAPLAAAIEAQETGRS